MMQIPQQQQQQQQQRRRRCCRLSGGPNNESKPMLLLLGLLAASTTTTTTTTTFAFQSSHRFAVRMPTTTTPSSSSSSSSRSSSSPTTTAWRAVSIDASDLTSTTTTTSKRSSDPNNNNNNDNNNLGAMMDLTGIAFSGLKGKALSWRPQDFPSAKDLRAVIPADCFEPDTARSLGYLSVSLLGTVACTAVGIGLLSIANPANPWTWPLWSAYAAVTGTVAMGLWVLAHECGHGAFSKNKALQDAVGYTLHSLLLVPYYSWQRSHAVHHRYTNHMELGETHVPEPIQWMETTTNKNKNNNKKNGDDTSTTATATTATTTTEIGGSYAGREFFRNVFGETRGIQAWGVLQGFVHLIIGWPAYLLIGATGGPARGMTNHFLPNPLTTPAMPKKELFPGNWKEKVITSDVGIAAVVGGLAAWALCHGIPEVMALYGGPLVIVNAWLVLYTWLQHTDVDVPHFSNDQHNFVKGALHTIDRPYDKLDPWGLVDFLHHKIGSTHVAHHFDSTIPHYKAQAASEAIQEAYPEMYLYDPTPIPQALWRVCRGCTAVELRGDKWVWKNNGLEQSLQD